MHKKIVESRKKQENRVKNKRIVLKKQKKNHEKTKNV